MPKKDNNSIDVYRKESKAQLIERQDEFWKAWDSLRPKDKVETYIKMMSFFVPKVAVEVPLTPEQLKQMDADKEERAANLITAGLAEDIDYEDE